MLFIVNNYSQEYMDSKGKSFEFLLRYAVNSPLNFTKLVVLKPTTDHIHKLSKTIENIHSKEPSAIVRIILSGSDYNVDAKDKRSKAVLNSNIALCRISEQNKFIRLFGICYGAQAILMHLGITPVVHDTACKGFYQICKPLRPGQTDPLEILTVWSNYSRVFDFDASTDIDVIYVYCTGVNKSKNITYYQKVQVFSNHKNIMGTTFHPERLPSTHFLIDRFFQ